MPLTRDSLLALYCSLPYKNRQRPILAQEGQAIDLLPSDFTLPGMSGLDLFQACRLAGDHAKH